ncbi:MAG: hypothetical protein AAB685_00710, partial [Patescibacteria group bacterium]
IYFLFLVFFSLTILWSKNVKESLNYFLWFVGGGAAWIFVYNFREVFEKLLVPIITLLGIVSSVIFLLNQFFPSQYTAPFSLFYPPYASHTHSQLGNLWSILLIIIVDYVIRTKKWGWLFLGVPSVYFLSVSLSRSAYVSLAVGLIFLFWQRGLIARYKRYLYAGISLTVLLFVASAFQKTTLFSRPYFVQGIVGIIRNPFGVGVGNFSIISKDFGNHIFGMSGYSAFAQNIVLEILTGMGVFGFSFVLWLYFVMSSFWKKNELILFQAVFVAILTSFMFNASYIVPFFLWLWFMALGLSIKESDRIEGYLHE